VRYFRTQGLCCRPPAPTSVSLALCYLDLLEFQQVPLIDVSALAAVLSARAAEPPACDCSQHVHSIYEKFLCLSGHHGP